ncbi:MAG TPA: hypothetical protein VIR33_03170 [Thermopolyspora sp.]
MNATRETGRVIGRLGSRVRAFLGRAPARPLTGLSAVLVAGLMILLGSGPAAGAATPVTSHVFVIGVPGLRWSDLDQGHTPHLWGLVGRGATASLSTRTIPPPDQSITCPIGGWLTISAGQRAGSGDAGCLLPPGPETAADGSATVPGWQELASFNSAGPYGARIGLLGQAVLDAGGKVAAIGPGAALAAADSSGRVAKYAKTPDQLGDATTYNLVIAEVDSLFQSWPAVGPARQEERRRAVEAADTRVGQILRLAAPDSTVLVAGVSDVTATAHLHVAMAVGAAGPPGAAESYRVGSLTSTATRQDGLVTITDLTATVLDLLGIGVPEGVVGRPWTSDGRPPSTPAIDPTNPRISDPAIRETVTGLADADVASQVLREVRAPFFGMFVAVQLLFYGVAALAIRRRVGGAKTLSAMRVVGVVGGGIAVSTFLAQLVPWWSLARPMIWLIATILGFACAITGLAFAGPWRRDVLGPLTVVGGVTSLALLIDVLTGSRLQVNAVTGYEPVTGGRFYGFSNIAFAVYATGTILALAGLARFLTLRGWRAAAVAVCLGYGGSAIIVDGWPALGADFGGVPAFVLGFAVFVLMLSGRRVSAARLALIALAGGVLIGLIAVGDWLRPADRRTHLGAFVQQVIDGHAFTIVGRKFAAMLGITVGNWQLSLLSLAALAFLFLVLARPTRWGAPILSRAYDQAPALRAGLFGVLTCALAGFLLNDSGVAIPAMALAVAVPLTLAACVRALRISTPTTPGRRSAPAEPTARPAP